MKSFIIALLFVLLSSVAFADAPPLNTPVPDAGYPNPSTTGVTLFTGLNAAAGGAYPQGTFFKCGGMATVRFKVTGTFSGTVTFYHSMDGGSTWDVAYCVPNDGGTAVTSTTAPGKWSYSCASDNLFGVGISSYTSGSVSAFARGSMLSLKSSVSGGGGGTGSAQSVMPVGLYLHSNTGTPNTQVDYSVRDAILTDGTASKEFTAFSGTVAATANGANGLDTGSLANSTIYIEYLIGQTSTTTDAMILSTSTTSPTMPSGYTFYRPVGWVVTDGSAHIRVFRQTGDTIRWDATPLNLWNTTTPGASIQTATTTSAIPAAFCREVMCYSQISLAGTDQTFYGSTQAGGQYFLAACAYDTREYWIDQTAAGQFYWSGGSGSGSINFAILGAKFGWY